MTETRAQRIGRLILANCDAYHAGARTREQWDIEQRRNCGTWRNAIAVCARSAVSSYRR